MFRLEDWLSARPRTEHWGKPIDKIRAVIVTPGSVMTLSGTGLLLRLPGVDPYTGDNKHAPCHERIHTCRQGLPQRSRTAMPLAAFEPQPQGSNPDPRRGPEYDETHPNMIQRGWPDKHSHAGMRYLASAKTPVL